jgi:hypothetical protein
MPKLIAFILVNHCDFPPSDRYRAVISGPEHDRFAKMLNDIQPKALQHRRFGDPLAEQINRGDVEG